MPKRQVAAYDNGLRATGDTVPTIPLGLTSYHACDNYLIASRIELTIWLALLRLYETVRPSLVFTSKSPWWRIFRCWEASGKDTCRISATSLTDSDWLLAIARNILQRLGSLSTANTSASPWSSLPRYCLTFCNSFVDSMAGENQIQFVYAGSLINPFSTILELLWVLRNNAVAQCVRHHHHVVVCFVKIYDWLCVVAFE